MGLLGRESSGIYEPELEGVNAGVVIQITSIAVYLYISKTGTPSSTNNSALSFEDLDSNYIEVSGTYISVGMKSIHDLDATLTKFGIDNINLPIIKIEIRNI
ncbi:hypothetical protein ACOMCU_00600 [Lysinibacillus sp. UGB7]|uniref:hypothetical protein n=1 Tax=Lysinibacillus sp. UGB7 TaxID=3411039 RepID=UPI003B7A1590